jgi:tetrahydromethanopterin S-methyltransferase subunit F
MTENSDYRLFLNEKFGNIEEKFEGMGKLINAQFSDVHERLDKIEAQTTKTNGRVTDVERQVILHPVNCPNSPKIETIDKTLEDIRFFIKYPKLAVGIATVFIIIFLGSAVAFYSGLKSNLIQTKENKELIIKNDSTIKTLK